MPLVLPSATTPAGLEAAFARYETSLDCRDRAEQLTARLGLCLALIDTGWTPSAVVRDQMERDQRALRRLRDDVVDLRDVLDLTRAGSVAPDARGARSLPGLPVTAAGTAADATAARRPPRPQPPT